VIDAIERWLEVERDQLPLWLPVALAAGIACWFFLPDPYAWRIAIIVALGFAAWGSPTVVIAGRAGHWRLPARRLRWASASSGCGANGSQRRGWTARSWPCSTHGSTRWHRCRKAQCA
jgi:hypothetical protein